MADNKNFEDAPISISDAASMLRRTIKNNERPYTKIVLKLNNRMVDDWKKTLLVKLADNRGFVRASKIWQSWLLYEEGKHISQYVELRAKGLLPRPSKEVLEYWKEFFKELSVEEMHPYGHAMISQGWYIITLEIRRWCADQKWEKIFSKSKDPWDWEKEQYKHQDLMQGKLYPFWNEEIIKDVKAKVITILQIQVQPQT